MTSSYITVAIRNTFLMKVYLKYSDFCCAIYLTRRLILQLKKLVNIYKKSILMNLDSLILYIKHDSKNTLVEHLFI